MPGSIIDNRLGGLPSVSLVVALTGLSFAAADSVDAVEGPEAEALACARSGRRCGGPSCRTDASLALGFALEIPATERGFGEPFVVAYGDDGVLYAATRTVGEATLVRRTPPPVRQSPTAAADAGAPPDAGALPLEGTDGRELGQGDEERIGLPLPSDAAEAEEPAGIAFNVIAPLGAEGDVSSDAEGGVHAFAFGPDGELLRDSTVVDERGAQSVSAIDYDVQRAEARLLVTTDALSGAEVASCAVPTGTRQMVVSLDASSSSRGASLESGLLSLPPLEPGGQWVSLPLYFAQGIYAVGYDLQDDGDLYVVASQFDLPPEATCTTLTSERRMRWEPISDEDVVLEPELAITGTALGAFLDVWVGFGEPFAMTTSQGNPIAEVSAACAGGTNYSRLLLTPLLAGNEASFLVNYQQSYCMSTDPFSPASSPAPLVTQGGAAGAALALAGRGAPSGVAAQGAAGLRAVAPPRAPGATSSGAAAPGASSPVPRPPRGPVAVEVEAPPEIVAERSVQPVALSVGGEQGIWEVGGWQGRPQAGVEGFARFVPSERAAAAGERAVEVALSGGGHTLIRDAGLDAQENLIVVGDFSGELLLGGRSVAAQGHSDLFVAQLDRQGRLLWSQVLSGPGTDVAAKLSVDARNARIAVTGRTEGGLDFGAGPMSEGVFLVTFDLIPPELAEDGTKCRLGRGVWGSCQRGICEPAHAGCRRGRQSVGHGEWLQGQWRRCLCAEGEWVRCESRRGAPSRAAAARLPSEEGRAPRCEQAGRQVPDGEWLAVDGVACRCDLGEWIDCHTP